MAGEFGVIQGQRPPEPMPNCSCGRAFPYEILINPAFARAFAAVGTARAEKSL